MVMSSPGETRSQLNGIVELVADALQADVCSVYLRREGDLLELFANKGLAPEAINQVRMRIGEGLTGLIAKRGQSMAFRDAHKNPQAVTKPYIDEHLYPFLAGVPILRRGQLVGVLNVRHRAEPSYTEEEIEALETVAMVIAELVHASRMLKTEHSDYDSTQESKSLKLIGVSIHGGVAIGQAFLHQPQVRIHNTVADHPDQEIVRFEEAMKHVQENLGRVLRKAGTLGPGEHVDVLETLVMFSKDLGWLRRVEDGIRTGLSAEAAVQLVQNDYFSRMQNVADPYLRDRFLDMEELTQRLIKQLAGADFVSHDFPDETILVARSIGPAALLEMPREKLKGLVLEEGSQTSHLSIIARALDVPVVARLPHVMNRVRDFDQIVVDGTHGQVFLRPDADVLDSVRERQKIRAERQKMYKRNRHLPATTLDGVDVALMINAGLRVDVQNLDDTGGQGIGLYRTELPFMMNREFPTYEEQVELYRYVMDQAGNRPVVFRTLDMGGDKVVSFLPAGADENPSMGWRGLRVMLDNPIFFRRQLAALIQAADGRDLHVMFPMVAEVAEFDQAKILLDAELVRAKEKGKNVPNQVKVGAMFEVPSLFWQLQDLFDRVDFLSVGSNDLVQFMLACDRGSPKLTGRYDPLSPVVMRMFKTLADAAEKTGVPITICGEIAGRNLEAMTLIALGFRRFSMASSAVGPIKEMVRQLDVSVLRPYIDRMLTQTDHSFREKLKAFAQDHGFLTGV